MLSFPLTSPASIDLNELVNKGEKITLDNTETFLIHTRQDLCNQLGHNRRNWSEENILSEENYPTLNLYKAN